MNVRLLDENDIPQAKALWKQAFSDSDAFIDWYFKNKVSSGNSIGLFDGGLVSVLHMVPFKISVQGRHLSSVFITGAATEKKRRGEGLMRTVLKEALSLLRHRKIFMAHLYPFKHSFYENYGWATYSYVNRLSASRSIWQQGAEIFETTDYLVLDLMYRKMMRGFDGYVIRDKKEWLWRLGELESDGGKVAVVKKNDVPCAYMLYFGNNKKADIIETVYSDKQDLATLLAHILGQGYDRADYFIPAEKHRRPMPHGMARVVDANALLHAFGAEHLLEYVNIVDDFAKWNNTNNIYADQEMSIDELARIFHQGISLQIGEEDYETNILTNDLRNIFSHQNTCIFEAY